MIPFAAMGRSFARHRERLRPEVPISIRNPAKVAAWASILQAIPVLRSGGEVVDAAAPVPAPVHGGVIFIGK